MSGLWPYRTGGIPDELFQRGSVPMSKAQVRVLALAQLRLADGQVIWDVGAGTGAVSVEAALLCPGGRVYAVERRPQALDLIEANRRRFGAANLQAVAGEAPAALVDLPRPDRVFVGGSGGALAAILGQAAQSMRPGGRLVLSAVTLETMSEGFRLLAGLFGPVEAVFATAAVAGEAGAFHLFRAPSPVCLLAVEKGR